MPAGCHPLLTLFTLFTLFTLATLPGLCSPTAADSERYYNQHGAYQGRADQSAKGSVRYYDQHVVHTRDVGSRVLAATVFTTATAPSKVRSVKPPLPLCAYPSWPWGA